MSASSHPSGAMGFTPSSINETTYAPETKIFVGHLPDECTVETLTRLFSRFGNVAECDIINKYAFIHMENSKDAEKAIIDLNNYSLNGSRISVEKSKSSRHPYPGTPGRAGHLPKRIDKLSQDAAAQFLRQQNEKNLIMDAQFPECNEFRIGSSMPSSDINNFRIGSSMPPPDITHFRIGSSLPSADASHFRIGSSLPSADASHFRIGSSMPSPEANQFRIGSSMPSTYHISRPFNPLLGHTKVPQVDHELSTRRFSQDMHVMHPDRVPQDIHQLPGATLLPNDPNSYITLARQVWFSQARDNGERTDKTPPQNMPPHQGYSFF